MSKLLLTVKASKMMSVEWRPAILYVYEDKMVFENRGLISKDEAVINYTQVAQIIHHKGIIKSSLEVINTGGAKNIKIEHLDKKLAEEAKNIIEQKSQEAHAGKTTSAQASSLDDLSKLAELKEKGILTEEEFQLKKKQILRL